MTPAAVDTLPFRAGQWGVEFSLGSFAQPSASSLFGGLSADVGAQWMVTSSLSLGARWQAQAVVGRDRERTRTTSGSGSEQTGTSLSVLLGRVGVLGTLYF